MSIKKIRASVADPHRLRVTLKADYIRTILSVIDVAEKVCQPGVNWLFWKDMRDLQSAIAALKKEI
jgi:hypothetical protein